MILTRFPFCSMRRKLIICVENEMYIKILPIFDFYIIKSYKTHVFLRLRSYRVCHLLLFFKFSEKF